MPTSLEVNNNPEQLSESIFCYSPRTLAAMEACSNRRQKKAEEKQVEELSATTDEADTASEAWSTEANGDSASATAAIGADGRMMLLTMLTMAAMTSNNNNGGPGRWFVDITKCAYKLLPVPISARRVK